MNRKIFKALLALLVGLSYVSAVSPVFA